jgi:hypothetical protein
VQNLLDKFGAGQLMDQLSELKLEELLSTPPPGLDEAIAISKVVEFVESEEYARFTRIVFDTAPTGHTLRMLSLPDFVAAALEKVQNLQSKLGTGGPILQAIFGNPQGLQSSAEQLKKLEERVLTVSRLFRCFIYVLSRVPERLILGTGALCSCSLTRMAMLEYVHQTAPCFLSLYLKANTFAQVTIYALVVTLKTTEYVDLTRRWCCSKLPRLSIVHACNCCSLQLKRLHNTSMWKF